MATKRFTVVLFLIGLTVSLSGKVSAQSLFESSCGADHYGLACDCTASQSCDACCDSSSGGGCDGIGSRFDKLFKKGSKNCCDTGNWYVSAFGGYVDETRNDFSLVTVGPNIGGIDVDGNFSTDSGFGLGTAIGRRFSNGFRIEGDFVYRNQELDNLTSLVNETLSARLQTYSLNTNVAYDFRRGSKISPYIGGGTGVQFVDIKASDSSFDGQFELAYPTVNFQWFAGASSPINQRTEVFVEYRGLGTFGIDASASVGADSLQANSSSYQGSIFSGLRFTL